MLYFCIFSFAKHYASRRLSYLILCLVIWISIFELLLIRLMPFCEYIYFPGFINWIMIEYYAPFYHVICFEIAVLPYCSGWPVVVIKVMSHNFVLWFTHLLIQYACPAWALPVQGSHTVLIIPTCLLRHLYELLKENTKENTFNTMYSRINYLQTCTDDNSCKSYKPTFDLQHFCEFFTGN